MNDALRALIARASWIRSAARNAAVALRGRDALGAISATTFEEVRATMSDVAAFRFEALDGGGKTASGVIESDSPRQARATLRGRGLLPIAIEPISGPEIRRSWSARARAAGLSRFQLALLTRQFATLLGAGLTVEQALIALTEQCPTPAERERLAAVRSEVLSGHALATAFTAAGFPELYCALIAAGERSGKLDAVMAKLADYLERREDALLSLERDADVGVVESVFHRM
jgi:type II secretory pathway component PulF